MLQFMTSVKYQLQFNCDILPWLKILHSTGKDFMLPMCIPIPYGCLDLEQDCCSMWTSLTKAVVVQIHWIKTNLQFLQLTLPLRYSVWLSPLHQIAPQPMHGEHYLENSGKAIKILLDWALYTLTTSTLEVVVGVQALPLHQLAPSIYTPGCSTNSKRCEDTLDWRHFLYELVCFPKLIWNFQHWEPTKSAFLHLFRATGSRLLTQELMTSFLDKWPAH